MDDLLSQISISALAQLAPPVAGGAGPSDQATTPVTGSQPLGPGGPAQPKGPGGLGMLFPMMIAFLAIMILTSVMGSRKERRRRNDLLGSLARYDRVQTSGGLIGTIVDVTDDEIVLKVDEGTNTKIHFSRSSVQTVLRKGRSGKSDSLEPAETAA